MRTVLAIMVLLPACVHVPAPGPLRAVFLLDRRQVAATRDAATYPRTTARQRACGPFSVTAKAGVAPSGDKHDFVSLNPYRWPDPRSPNGLPYVKKDGQVNPETERYGDETALE